MFHFVWVYITQRVRSKDRIIISPVASFIPDINHSQMIGVRYDSCEVARCNADIMYPFINPFQAWVYHCHLHSLQAANCCRNSRLVVDEDDLMWFKNWRNCHVLESQFHGNFHSKGLICRKIKPVFRDVKWCFNASWGLKGIMQELFHPL